MQDCLGSLPGLRFVDLFLAWHSSPQLTVLGVAPSAPAAPCCLASSCSRGCFVPAVRVPHRRRRLPSTSTLQAGVGPQGGEMGHGRPCSPGMPP